MPVYQSQSRFRVVACGRRFGKTMLNSILLSESMLKGWPCAYFAPTYKQLAFVWRDIKQMLAPVIAEKSEGEHRIKLFTGGTLDMWSMDGERPGIGRKYKRVVVDEAGMCPNLKEQFNEAIRPTLTDYRGDGVFSGTPKGRNYFWQVWCLGNDPDEPEWQSFHMPSSMNPYLDIAEIEAARKGMPDRAFRQEYLAEFIEESGGVFRKVAEAVDAGRSHNEEPREGVAYYLGVDLARVEDFTVISVFDQTGRQVYFERFNEISWERQLESIERVAKRYNNAHVLVDATGIGDPLLESIRKRGVRGVEGYNLTHGSKEALIDKHAMGIEHGDFRFMAIGVQTNEHMAYEYQMTKAGNVRMGAPEGMHDDTVIAAALATWRLRLRAVRIYKERPDPMNPEEVHKAAQRARNRY